MKIKGNKGLAVVVVSIGAVLLVVAALRLTNTVEDLIGGTPLTTPGTTTVHLDEGEWVVFERVGSQENVGPIQRRDIGPSTLSAANVSVAGPAAVSVSIPDLTNTINDGESVFVGIAELDIPVEGDYQVTMVGGPVETRVTRSVTSSLGRSAVAFGAGVVGFVVLVVGIILCVIAFSRQRAVSPQVAVAAPPGVTPPGWHPDPSGQARLRWWDGTRWTDDISP